MAQRLKGQEVVIKVVRDGVVATEIASIGSMNDNVDLEMKQDGFLGRTVNDFDDILNGFGGDLEFQTSNATWVEFQQAVIARATRATPGLVFNVIRTDFYGDGSTNIFTYSDVKFGAMPTSIASRGDFVKIKLAWGCSERPVKTNGLL